MTIDDLKSVALVLFFVIYGGVIVQVLRRRAKNHPAASLPIDDSSEHVSHV